MNPASNQALRIAIVHERDSVIKQLQADNERLQNELANAKANLNNRYLRSVLNLIDKHRDMGFGGLDVLDDRLVLNGEGDEDDDSQEMLDGLVVMPVAEKLKVIPILCELGYFVLEFKPTLHDCPFAVDWNTTEERLRHVYSGFFSRGGILHRPTNISE